LPIKDQEQGNADFQTDTAYSKEVIKRLIGNNPRKIVFLEASQSDGTFLNPWDKQYLMYMDANYDNQITIGTNTIYSQVVVYCNDDSTNVYYSFNR
jgi:hypothetical protein